MFPSLFLVLLIVLVSAAGEHDRILLSDGNRMPILSLGTVLRIEDVHLVKPAIIRAIELGYRQIDTASVYKNEEQIGEGIADVIRRGIVTREELFITTKLSLAIGTREGVLPGIRSSLEKLQLDYVDLYLIHSPKNLFFVEEYDFVEVWKGMEEVKKLNLTRSIGVSNFEIDDLKKLLANSDVKPAVNEFEVSTCFTNLDLVAYCQSLDIVVLSYAPFGFMVPRPYMENPSKITFDHPVLVKIARKYHKTTNQVVIRYLMDRGTVPIPRSHNLEHIKSNFDVFDFSLTQNEIQRINKLNEDERTYNFDKESFDAIIDYYGLL